MVEDYEVGGVNYTLRAAESSRGGFFGCWTCRACGTSGTRADTASTVREAIAIAKISLLDHHADAHPDTHV